jgi:hypothetical protein
VGDQRKGGGAGPYHNVGGEEHCDEVGAVATPGPRRAHALMIGCGASGRTVEGNSRRKHAAVFSSCAVPLSPAAPPRPPFYLDISREQPRASGRESNVSFARE